MQLKTSFNVFLFAVALGSLLNPATILAADNEATAEPSEAQTAQIGDAEVVPAVAAETESTLLAEEFLIPELLQMPASAMDAAAAGNGCFPPSPPPPSCECGSCCECNKCWSNGILRRVPCDDP